MRHRERPRRGIVRTAAARGDGFREAGGAVDANDANANSGVE